MRERQGSREKGWRWSVPIVAVCRGRTRSRCDMEVSLFPEEEVGWAAVVHLLSIVRDLRGHSLGTISRSYLRHELYQLSALSI